MEPLPEAATSKTIFVLSLELGVRNETVLAVMREMGLEADNLSISINPEIQESIVERMVEKGVIAARAADAAKRRQITEQPFADDEILAEALGASELGYSEARIPPQILQQTSIAEKPSLFQRLFGKKKEIAQSLKEYDVSEEELQNLFEESGESEAEPASMPVIEVEREDSILEETGDMETVQDTFEEEAFEEEAPELEEALSDLAEEMEEIDGSLTELEELEGEEELEAVEIEEEEEITELDDEELQALSSLEEEDLGVEELEIEDQEFDEELEIDGSLAEEALEASDEDLDPVLESRKLETEEPAPGFLGKYLKGFQFTQTELYTMMGGGAVITLFVLGVTFYWLWNISPKAQKGLWEQAEEYFKSAQEAQRLSEYDKSVQDWRRAAETYAKFYDKFSDHPLAGEAFHRTCRSYYNMAKDYEDSGRQEKSEEPYQKTAEYYQQFLTYLERMANRMVSDDPQNVAASFPDIDKQKEAMFRIAYAQRRLLQFDTSVEKLREFAGRFPDSEEAREALLDIGDTYRDWANVDKESESSHLKDAIDAYKDALDHMGETEREQRAKIYAGLGDIEYRNYEKADAAGDEQGKADAHLGDAIAYYELAETELRALDNLPIEEKKRVFKTLADFNLIRGWKASEEWEDMEKSAESFPAGSPLKQTLLDAIGRKRATIEGYLNKAGVLYDELLRDRDLLEPDMFQEIMYNKAYSLYILREFPQTITVGEELLDPSNNLDTKMAAKVYYLLGNAAWEEAASTGDYSKVKRYYRDALQLDPFYPAEEKGKISHLAEIRLTNSYFLLDKKYEEAIARFQRAVENYPETGYSYLTLCYYGKALEDYGDELVSQAEEKERQAKELGGDAQLEAEAGQLRQKARDQFQKAKDAYSRAINSRENSIHRDTINETYLIRVTFNRGHSAYKAGLLEESAQFFNSALEQFNDHRVAKPYIPPAIERLGDIYVRLADYGKAISYYKTYLNNAFEDRNNRVTMKLGDAYLKQLSYDKARRVYQGIFENDPPPTLREIRRRQSQGLPLERTIGFDALRKIAESYYQEAYSYFDNERIKKLNQALETYQKLASLYPWDDENTTIPSDTKAQRTIGDIQYELENYQEAIDQYEAFLKNVPQYPRKGNLMMKIGKSYLELGKFDEAVTSFSNISESDLDNAVQYADSLIWLGRAL